MYPINSTSLHYITFFVPYAIMIFLVYLWELYLLIWGLYPFLHITCDGFRNHQREREKPRDRKNA
uniref:Uncharacterized protein n=1 Tax=Helianthus annuus TaxID=4232 RepID=A0A251TF28_HELAN